MVLQVGVKILLQNELGEFLFVLRANTLNNAKDHLWDIPGGRINSDEKVLIALKREIEEEIGIEITQQPVLLAAQDIFVPQKDFHVVRLTYHAQILSSQTASIRLSDEHQDFRWFKTHDLAEMHIDPYVQDI